MRGSEHLVTFKVWMGLRVSSGLSGQSGAGRTGQVEVQDLVFCRLRRIFQVFFRWVVTRLLDGYTHNGKYWL